MIGTKNNMSPIALVGGGGGNNYLIIICWSYIPMTFLLNSSQQLHVLRIISVVKIQGTGAYQGTQYKEKL